MQRKLWDASHFNEINLPEVVGKVHEDMFSKFNNVRVLDMPVYMPDQGWRIPDNVMQFIEPIALASQHERRYGDFEKDHYVYITIDQKTVVKGKTGRRPGAHSDSYIETQGQQIDLTHESAEAIAEETGEVSHTYIIYDKNPTEFFSAPFPLNDTSCNGSLRTFDEIADSATPITYPCYTLLKLDPFVVHRCSLVTETANRTFVKVSISRKKYARKGNTVNPMFDYDWEMTARSPSERNHPWV